jgi:hypothetical protein
MSEFRGSSGRLVSCPSRRMAKVAFVAAVTRILFRSVMFAPGTGCTNANGSRKLPGPRAEIQRQGVDAFGRDVVTLFCRPVLSSVASALIVTVSAVEPTSSTTSTRSV